MEFCCKGRLGSKGTLQRTRASSVQTTLSCIEKARGHLIPLCLPQTFIHTSGQEPWPLAVGDMQASPKMCHHETNAEEENPHAKCIDALLLGYVETTPRKSSATVATNRIATNGVDFMQLKHVQQ